MMMSVCIYIYTYNEDNYTIGKNKAKKKILTTIGNEREVSNTKGNINRDHMKKKAHAENIEVVAMRMTS
jgi:hypothetical protein